MTSATVKPSIVKPGSHLCDKHNTSDISISISTRKKEHSFFLVLMLMLMSLVLCLSHKCEPGLTDAFDDFATRSFDFSYLWFYKA